MNNHTFSGDRIGLVSKMIFFPQNRAGVINGRLEEPANQNCEQDRYSTQNGWKVFIETKMVNGMVAPLVVPICPSHARPYVLFTTRNKGKGRNCCEGFVRLRTQLS